MTKSQISANSPAPAAQRSVTTLVDITIAGDPDIVVRVEVHESGGQRWIELPTEAQLGSDGRIVGLTFGDEGARNCFMQKVLKALDGGAS